METTTKNRWLIAASAVFIHISIGAAYAYSVYTQPLVETKGWSMASVTTAFTIMMVLGGGSAALFGKFVERSGPRKSAMLAAVLFGLGQAGSGFAISMDSLTGFLLSYGLLSGLGLGIGYIAPVSTLVKWFPDKRGLATGMAVLGFGTGALITAPVAASLIESIGISYTFYILGISYFVLMTLGASYIAPPPRNWMPAGMKAAVKAGTRKIKKDLSQATSGEAVRTKHFWMLWTMMLINTSAEIMMISVASPMAQNIVGLSAGAAATMVGIMGVFNGGGRLGWAAASDYISRPKVFIIFFIIQLAAFITLPIITSAFIFQIFIFLVVSCYGGGFSNLPAFIGDLFGTKELGAIHGYLLTTWSLGGLIGPTLVSQIYTRTGSYTPVFYVFTGLIIIALIISILLNRSIQKVKSKEEKLQYETATPE
ncbi:L-lactate MFS transporter [Salegentibacter mishustinae]|uniref:MFS transporter n=1 Tax=Salegentibacter mishustinae TaxID=270918 RepID=A0A0Q9ZG70_9FLAO|nr:OFA family MFS transporter [Salegentibacter mishustinae]KRG28366.1 MFS transporter [Salegentibacter mishustinae]PNW22300.1 MFS transporter [Salegentibacter mishustinae]PZX67526.1 OFA family oxalate/formate antiporter-like MFS transporter [Salegentibacter mishustinae]GGW79167.1 MFS transporter [Salegentibacter mishustinae]